MTQKTKPESEAGFNSIELPSDIDEKNRQILEILRRDGRITFAELSKQLDMNESTVRKRVRKLVDDEVIDHFTVVLNPTLNGKKITSFLTVISESHYKINELSNQVIKLSEVIEAFYMSGKCGLLLRVQIANLEELDSLLERMREIPGIGEIESCIIIRQLKYNRC